MDENNVDPDQPALLEYAAPNNGKTNFIQFVSMFFSRAVSKWNYDVYISIRFILFGI